MRRQRKRLVVIDATAERPRELTRGRGPTLERETLTASIAEHCLTQGTLIRSALRSVRANRA